MKVIILDTVHPVLLRGLEDMGAELVEDYESSKLEVMEKMAEYEGMIIRSRFPVDKDFLSKANNLKFIGRVGAGMENIDIPFAENKNILLISAPEGNRDAVGEHALGMLLMLANNLKRSDEEVRNGQWRREANRGFEIGGKTIGIIGYGNMGSAFAKKLAGFKVEILAYDKYKSGFANDKVKEVSLKELQERSDIVSLHIPQTEETIAMVNSEFINAFEKDFYIINTARGRVIETTALVQGLKDGKLKGACLDVLEYEKASFENMFSQELPEAFEYLINSDKVILSPHIAGWSHESNEKMAKVILEKIKIRLNR